jgi:hypothetical protein
MNRFVSCERSEPWSAETGSVSFPAQPLCRVTSASGNRGDLSSRAAAYFMRGFHEKAIICQATWRSFSSSCLWESGKRPRFSRFYTFPQAVSPFFGWQVA